MQQQTTSIPPLPTTNPISEKPPIHLQFQLHVKAPLQPTHTPDLREFQNKANIWKGGNSRENSLSSFLLAHSIFDRPLVSQLLFKTEPPLQRQAPLPKSAKTEFAKTRIFHTPHSFCARHSFTTRSLVQRPFRICTQPKSHFFRSLKSDHFFL